MARYKRSGMDDDDTWTEPTVPEGRWSGGQVDTRGREIGTEWPFANQYLKQQNTDHKDLGRDVNEAAHDEDFGC